MSVDIENGVYTKPSKLTVGQWLDIWLDEYLGNVKPHTVTSYRTQCTIYIKPQFGAVKLTALNTNMIQKFYNELQRKKGLSPKTIHNIHGVLHKALKQAVYWEYIRINSSKFCNPPRIERKELHPMDEKDIKKFLEAIS